MIDILLNQFNPEPDVLLRAISAYISDEILQAISTADYGMDSEEYLVALRQVRDTGTFPRDLVRFPMEALELIRWSEPENSEWKPGRTGKFGHWMRAFSCAAILRAQYPPYNYPYNDGCTDSTVIQLLASLPQLPVNFHSQAAQHFSWLILNSKPECQNEAIREYGVALLWLSLHVTSKVPDETLVSVAQWLIRRADQVNWKRSENRSGLREMVLDCMKGRAWELLGVEFCSLDLSSRSPELQASIQLAGEQLCG